MQIEERKPANSIVESKNHWRDIHPLPLSWFFEVTGFFEQLPGPITYPPAAENVKVSKRHKTGWRQVCKKRSNGVLDKFFFENVEFRSTLFDTQIFPRLEHVMLRVYANIQSHVISNCIVYNVRNVVYSSRI